MHRALSWILYWISSSTIIRSIQALSWAGNGVQTISRSSTRRWRRLSPQVGQLILNSKGYLMRPSSPTLNSSLTLVTIGPAWCSTVSVLICATCSRVIYSQINSIMCWDTLLLIKQLKDTIRIHSEIRLMTSNLVRDSGHGKFVLTLDGSKLPIQYNLWGARRLTSISFLSNV